MPKKEEGFMITDSINKALRVYNNDYFAIKNLVINRFTISGAIANVKLDEILGLPNLENLTLCNLCLDSYDLECIAKCSNLKYLSLINCEIRSTDEFLHVKNIILDNTSLELDEDYIYDQVVIKNRKMPLNKVKTVVLVINQAIVSDINVDNFKIKELVVSSSQYLKNKNYLDKLDSIKVSIKETKKVGD